jgi:hypothetical protein
MTKIPYSDQTFAQKQPGVSYHPEKKYSGFVHAETHKDDGYFS